MIEKVVLVTGSLAEPRLKRLGDELVNDQMDIAISNVGVKVAALMTTGSSSGASRSLTASTGLSCLADSAAI
jgi:hypothetical protein